MQTQVYEESVDLTIGLLEAKTPVAGHPDSAYPLPILEKTGKAQTRAFKQIVLENEYLRACFMPELGGRLTRLTQKPTKKDVIAWAPDLIERGLRGVELDSGLQIRLDRRYDRKNSLGAVDSLLLEEEGGVWFFEIDQGSGVTLHWRVTLPTDRAELVLETRAFNRTAKAQRYDPSIACRMIGGAFVWTGSGVASYDSAAGAGIVIWALDGPMDSAQNEDRCLQFCRFAQSAEKWLAPRQLDVWQVCIQPISGLDRLTAASREIAIEAGEKLRIQTVEDRPGHRLLVLDSNGQTIEAQIDLTPETVAEIDLPVKAEAIVIQDAEKAEVLRWESQLEKLTSWTAVVSDSPAPTELPSGLTDLDLARAGFDVALRAQAHQELGRRALASGHWRRAEEEFESCLLYNAEDHLAWWAKSLAARLGENPDDERPELLNAHFLAPLEPVLKAEAFLSSAAPGRDASPLLKSLETNPESFIEIACLLIDFGLLDQATVWIGEALRHADLQMLHFLLAWCHKKRGGSPFEVAGELQKAGKDQLRPPYPWRPAEVAALEDLAVAYPEEQRLKDALELTRLPFREPARTS